MSWSVKIENLGKTYRRGEVRAMSDNFRESVGHFVKQQFRAFSLGGRTGGDAGDEDRQEFWAIRGINMEVEAGKAFGVIGRNGAGKSTLLKILARITQPTTGTVRYRGRVAALLEVGTGFHRELTGRENIYLNGAILGMRRAEVTRKLDEIIEFSGVGPFVDTPVKFYSSGMGVRLAFAVAAHLEADILLMDEVLAVGDIAFQSRCLGKMESVVQRGRTVLFVSHNMQAIRQLCTRAVCLDGGGVVDEGTSDEVVDRYVQRMTQGGAAPDHERLIAGFPPDPAFRLKTISILQDGSGGTNVASGKPLTIRIEYDVLMETPGLHVYIMLYDSEGLLIFESLHNGDSDQPPVVRPGSYVSSATVPANLLAPRFYDLRVNASIHNVRNCIPEPLCYALHVWPSGPVNRAYPGYRTAGRLAPAIEWSTESRT